MARCVNCKRTTASPLNYDSSMAGTTVVLRYTGDKVASQYLTAPSGKSYTFSATQPFIVVDGGDVKTLLGLGFFEKGV